MHPFLSSLTTNDTFTTNGMTAHSHTGNEILQLYSNIAGLRGTDITNQLARCWKENPLLTLRLIFYLRDVRGGQGERELFRQALKWLAIHYPIGAFKILEHVPFYGRWDDLNAFQGTSVWTQAVAFWGKAIREGDGLACKWAPRESSCKDNKDTTDRNTFYALLRHLQMTPKTYRKHIAMHTKVVEQKMCAGKWNDIVFEHVPSNANMLYRQAFMKHDPTRYSNFIRAVQDGNKQMHSATLYPHEIVTKAFSSSDASLDAMWKSLPSWVGEKTLFPVCDVSGSMSSQMPGTKYNCLSVSISLGLYLAEKNKGPFEGYFFTFSEDPQLVKVQGKNLCEKVHKLQSAAWGINTNYEKMAQKLVSKVRKQSELPDYVVIFSDMQFDPGTTYGRNLNAVEVWRETFERKGFVAPNIIYWNLAAGTSPAKEDDSGVICISGFSPAILKAVLSSKLNEITPYRMMLDVLNSERYSRIAIG